METAMKTMTDKKRGWGLLSLGLDAFAGLGLEVVYAFLLEPLLYGASMEGWKRHLKSTPLCWTGEVLRYILNGSPMARFFLSSSTYIMCLKRFFLR